jgi:hypothetical protein
MGGWAVKSVLDRSGLWQLIGGLATRKYVSSEKGNTVVVEGQCLMGMKVQKYAFFLMNLSNIMECFW